MKTQWIQFFTKHRCCSFSIFSLMMSLCFLFIVSDSRASFRENQTRYLTSFDVINSFVHLFPAFKNHKASSVSNECASLGSHNNDALGVNSPGLLKPLQKGPNPSFIRWLERCQSEYMKFEFSSEKPFREGLARDYFPLVMIKKYQLQSFSQLREILKKNWSQLSEAEAQSLVVHQIFRLIGTENHLNTMNPPQGFQFYFQNQMERLRALQKKNPRVEEALKEITANIVMSDEFLRY